MDAITYAKEDYEYLKKVTAKLRTLEEYIGDKVTVTYFRMNKVCPFLNYVPHIAEGHLTEFIPFDYVGIKEIKEPMNCNGGITRIPFAYPGIIINEILDDDNKTIFKNEFIGEDFENRLSKLSSVQVMSYYRRKLFGNIIANIDIRYRFKYNGNVSYPRGIMGLPYYENEIQKLGLVQKGIYSYNLTMTENDVDIVNVPIYRWDDNNDVGVWRGRIARVKEK